MSKATMTSALRARYEADIAEADVTINIYLNLLENIHNIYKK
jgi:hypothetical protein